jgi:hypothetical protein
VSWSFFIGDTCVTVLAIHLYILHCSKALFPYCAESLQWISAPGTPSVHKNVITACYSSLMSMESRVTMLTLSRQHYNWLIMDKSISQSHRRLKFMPLPVRKISCAANTATFKINHCGHFLTHLHNSLILPMLLALHI